MLPAPRTAEVYSIAVHHTLRRQGPRRAGWRCATRGDSGAVRSINGNV